MYYKITVYDGYSLLGRTNYTLTEKQYELVKKLNIISKKEIHESEYNKNDFLSLLFSYGCFLNIPREWREAVLECMEVEHETV